MDRPDGRQVQHQRVQRRVRRARGNNAAVPTSAQRLLVLKGARVRARPYCNRNSSARRRHVRRSHRTQPVAPDFDDGEVVAEDPNAGTSHVFNRAADVVDLLVPWGPGGKHILPPGGWEFPSPSNCSPACSIRWRKRNNWSNSKWSLPTLALLIKAWVALICAAARRLASVAFDMAKPRPSFMCIFPWSVVLLEDCVHAQ